MSQSLLNGLSILEALDKAGTALGVREISRRSGVHPATTMRLLRSLETAAYVSREVGSGDYALTLKCYFLGQSTIRNDPLMSVANQRLRDFTKEYKVSAYLGVLRRPSAVYLQVIEDAGVVSTHVRPGDSLPVHSTALGRALVLDDSESDLRALFEVTGTPAMTPKTTTSAEELLQRIASERAQGYTVNNEENILGIASLAIPVRDHLGQIVAAVSVALPTSSLLDAETRRILSPLGDVTRAISLAYGYVGGD